MAIREKHRTSGGLLWRPCCKRGIDQRRLAVPERGFSSVGGIVCDRIVCYQNVSSRVLRTPPPSRNAIFAWNAAFLAFKEKSNEERAELR